MDFRRSKGAKMKHSNLDWRVVCALSAMFTFSCATALAQADEDLDEQEPAVEEAPPEDFEHSWAPRTVEPPPPAPAAPIEAQPPTDHALVVGRVGVGFLGVNSVPLCDFGSFDCGTGNLAAPTLGVRYWASERLGIELGVGVGASLGKRRQEDVGGETTIDDPTIGGVAIHGGLPIALIHSRHFAFLFSPETQFGFAKGSNDLSSVSGILFRAGFRIGAEIQFGFIGIPQLSLTAGIGLHGQLNHRARTTEDPFFGELTNSATSFNFGTNVQGNPWAIFTNGISALYYF
jgi:hypothetical protein